jgi:predicted PurR-regulated permease PerM
MAGMDMNIVMMAFTWTFMVVAMLAQNLSHGYTFNTIWMAFAIPMILRFILTSTLNQFLNVEWSFLFMVCLFTGVLTFAFSLVNPDLTDGLKNFGKNSKNTTKVLALFSGMFLFCLLLAGYISSDPFVKEAVEVVYNNGI